MAAKIQFKFCYFLILLFLSYNFSFAQSNGVIDRIETKEKEVALTFDADMTPKMLKELQSGKVKSWYSQDVINVLEKENIPATLFLTGMWVEQYATVTQELASNTLFEIGNHSYSHPGFSPHCFKLQTVVDDAADEYQISKTNDLLNKYAPNHKMYFRFPGLCYEPKDLQILAKENYVAIGGDVHSGDAFQNDYKIIVRNVVGKIKPGSIVVMHMMGGPNAPQTAKALPVIIDELKKQNYKFVKVSDLLGVNSSSSATSSPSLIGTFVNFLKNLYK